MLGDQWFGVLVRVGWVQSEVQGGGGDAGSGCVPPAHCGSGSLGGWFAGTGGCAGAGCALLGERRRIVVWSVAGGAGPAAAGGAVALLVAGPGAVGVGMPAGVGVTSRGVGMTVGVGVIGLAAGVAGLRGARG